MVDFGFPRDYVINCLRENDANYCTTGYYLLGLDQNYWIFPKIIIINWLLLLSFSFEINY
jgi:hypothetical protein